jgi:hypothetical protein
MRFFYYVSPLPDGQWELVPSLEPKAARLPTREEALAAARQGCRRQWENHGFPCGVRIRETETWIEDHLVGDEPAYD